MLIIISKLQLIFYFLLGNDFKLFCLSYYYVFYILKIYIKWLRACNILNK